MPSRNILRNDAPDTYYHVYLRGISKSDIFLDKADKDYFIYLISRHLSEEPAFSIKGYAYAHLRDKVELLSYCLMDNHLHLLFYQREQGSVAKLMQSLSVAYIAYFNRKHSRIGPLFESRYKSSRVDNDAYLLHISRYIHLNPRSWKNYKHSSLVHIRKSSEPAWLQTERILNLHDSREAYLQFTKDYEENLEILADIKDQLANNK